MSNQSQQAFKAFQQALQNGLESQFLSFYLIGGFSQDRSGTNLLAVIQPETSIHQIREILRPLWLQYHNTIGYLPLIATPATLNRHLQLNPLLADDIIRNGRLLSGQPLDFTVQSFSPKERIGHIAAEALIASESLNPQLQTKAGQKIAIQSLKRLANYLEIDTEQTPIQLLADIQIYLASWLNQNPGLKWQAPPPTDAPSLIQNLLSIYEVQERVVFLLPDLPVELIADCLNEIDWAAVSQTLKDQYHGLQLTTPSLLRLVYQYYRAAENLMKGYEHAWGQDPLNNLEVSHSQIYRDLARQPSKLEIKAFPHAYITVPDKALGELIHDFQNKLLNIQLREELLSRYERRSRAVPPFPLPGRKTPSKQRIDAIFQHFNWWANHYNNFSQTEPLNN